MVFLGREISEQRDYSDAVAEKIDAEVRQLIDQEYERARQILTENRATLDRIADTLLEVETLEADAFVAIVEGRDLPPGETRPSRSGTALDSSASPESQNTSERSAPKLDMPPSPSPA
jgi:cell division protease FtsH